MKLRRLGRTDLYASQIALGTVELGLDYGIPARGDHLRPAEPQAIRLLNQALDLGVNFIDTARAYGNSEELIGKALKHRRDDYILATKISPFDSSLLDSPSRLRTHIRSSVETSLRALEAAHIDLLMLHSAPMAVIQRADSLLEILDEIRRDGLVRYLGASVYEEAGPEALHHGFDCLQIAYNALDRAAEETMLPDAKRKGVGIVVRSVLLKGAITSRYRSLPEDLEPLKVAVRALDGLAAGAGMPLPELAFRYVLSSDGVALCGTAHSEELQSAIGYANRGPLDAALIAQIRSIDVSDKRFLNPGSWSIS